MKTLLHIVKAASVVVVVVDVVVVVVVVVVLSPSIMQLLFVPGVENIPN